MLDLGHGFEYPFRYNISGMTAGISSADELESVKSGIRQILKTKKGQRIMLPTFGCDLWKLKYEFLGSEFEVLASYIIRRDIEAWDDRILIGDIFFDYPEATHAVDIFICYVLKSLKVSDFVHFRQSEGQ